MRLITIKQIELRMSFLMKFKSLSCAVAVMSALSQGANAFDVKVEGIDGDVLSNVEVMLQPVRENSITDVRQTYRAQVDRAIQRGVQALGYYQSTIQYKWEEAKNEDGATLIAKVRLGKPVRVAGATLTVQGEAKNDEVFEAYKDLKGLKDQLSELEERKTALEEKIKVAFGDAEAISYGGQTLATWKAPKPSNKFDAKAFQAAHPDLAREFTIPAQGARRFLLK